MRFFKHRVTESQRKNRGLWLRSGIGGSLATLCLCASVFCTSTASAETYVGLSGSILLPQGGSRLARVGGAAARLGYYFNDDVALEGEAAWLEDAAGLAARGLWHLQGWQLYSDFFGYSRFDPFLTIGAAGWIARRGDGQVGPEAGVGAYYHLTDNWSLRADVRTTLGLDTEVEMLYTLSAGVQYSF